VERNTLAMRQREGNVGSDLDREWSEVDTHDGYTCVSEMCE
jgi:hypothetical protein